MNLTTRPTVRFISVTTQLGLLVLALWRFGIEESYGFPRILPLIFFGFLIHYLLPAAYRRTFFLAVSIAAIIIVLPFPHSLILLIIGLTLIGICHLPIRFGVRVGLVVAMGSLLAGLRFGLVSNRTINDLQVLILPVLGAMFMFRLAIYLYDLRHEKQPATMSERLSYFFLLPNVSFLLFPVIDYQTYRRSYYNSDEHAIYQKGILWMLRGLTHLVLYRLVYLYLVPAPGDVQSLTGVAQFAVTSYLLYLRISGQFHLIIGILCLFGFNLPETHHRYFLAVGFNDFWRRINIYWKDFMMKMIYYPTFVPLRKWGGMTTGIVLATIVVFLGTWLLHSYQWFWLRGSFPITATDGIFWGFLGVMVVVNSLREARGRKKEQALNLRSALARSAKTVGFFAMMSVLWSLWSSSTPAAWWGVVSKAGRSGIEEFALLLLILCAVIGVGALIQYLPKLQIDESTPAGMATGWRPALYVTGMASVFLFLSTPYARVFMENDTYRLVMSLRQERLNVRDQETVDRGYYEGLLEQGHFTSALWSARRGQPVDAGEFVPIQESAIVEKKEDLLEYELKASFTGTFKNAPFMTNAWRMRGGNYQREKPPGTYRIALVGASYEMAGGVTNEQTFVAVLEDILNGNSAGGSYSRFEVLNFSVAGYSMVHKAIVTETNLVPFEPDLVVVTLYSTEEVRLLSHMARTVENEIPIPYRGLQDIVDRSGGKSWMWPAQIRGQLEPHLYDIIEWSFRKLEADCQERDLRCVFLFMPTTTDKGNRSAQEQLDELWKRALNAGLEPVRLQDVYAGYEMGELQLSMWDSHLNVLGNRLFATGLYDWLTRYEPRVFLAGDTAGTSARIGGSLE